MVVNRFRDLDLWPRKNALQGMHFHVLVHVHTTFDQNPTSSLGATVVNGRTDGWTDRHLTNLGHLPKMFPVWKWEHKKGQNVEAESR